MRRKQTKRQLYKSSKPQGTAVKNQVTVRQSSRGQNKQEHTYSTKKTII